MGNGSCKIKNQYNPLKYFSQEIEDFLNSCKPAKNKFEKQITFAKDSVNNLEVMTFSGKGKKNVTKNLIPETALQQNKLRTIET